MPVELERLNGFPDDWTKLDGVSDNKRAFLMGNALVIGVVQQIGCTIFNRLIGYMDDINLTEKEAVN